MTIIDFGSSFSSPPETLRRASPPLDAEPAGDRLYLKKITIVITQTFMIIIRILMLFISLKHEYFCNENE